MVKTATFNGRKYDIVIGPLDGLTDASEDGFSMAIMANMQTRAGLETAIHEALHACNWQASEQGVKGAARDVARFLWRLGFRLKE